MRPSARQHGTRFAPASLHRPGPQMPLVFLLQVARYLLHPLIGAPPLFNSVTHASLVLFAFGCWCLTELPIKNAIACDSKVSYIMLCHTAGAFCSCIPARVDHRLYTWWISPVDSQDLQNKTITELLRGEVSSGDEQVWVRSCQVAGITPWRKRWLQVLLARLAGLYCFLRGC